MQTLLYVLLAVFVGAIISVYFPMNSSVSKYFGSPITANVSFFLVAFLTAILIFAMFGDIRTVREIKNIPPYLFLAGVISSFMVLGTTFLIPKLGARKLFMLLIAGQVIMAMIVSHFGILESPKDPVTFKKLAGAVILVFGAVISIA